MRKMYNTPSIKVTAYTTIDRTSIDNETSLTGNATNLNGTGRISSGTFKLNDLNS